MNAPTPAMKQYAEIRSGITDPNTILFFRMGDFYEMFFEDALVASKLLDIALTARNRNDPNPIPLCGVPYHAAQGYIDKLLACGKKVAICEQIEDPKTAKGVVKRAITQIVTPGVVFTGETVGSKSRFLVAIMAQGDQFGLAAADASTGELFVTQAGSLTEVLQELLRKDPHEVLLDEELRFDPRSETIERSLSHYHVTYFASHADSGDQLEKLSGFDRAQHDAALGCEAARMLWSYLHYTHREAALAHFTRVQFYVSDAHVRLDEATVKHLELVRSRETGDDAHTLLRCMDRTVTPMGGRRLKTWLLHPLRDLTAITERQLMLNAILNHTTAHLRLRTELDGMADLERIVGRIATQYANARDLVSLAQSLQKMPALITSLQVLPELAPITQSLHSLPELAERIVAAIVDEPPLSLKEGGVIRNGVHPELDELRAIRGSGKQFIAALEEQERKRTGINTLKIGFNRVFGYYLEITHAHREKIPADYIRKQTLTNAERYITPELKTYEEKVLGAEERITSLEYALFVELRDAVLPFIERLQATAESLGILDTLQGLALLAREERYVCPEMVVESVLEISDGRHPVVEQIQRSERFVPNDVMLTREQPIAMITGPNMAGKSTLMRQTALIVLMAHVGSFVPASRARIGVVDQIFTRVGASDNLAHGQSTFMVEMTEAATILAKATDQSVIIIDEIGRGTSTFDGVSIAWAVAEYLHDQIKARCLFATHYHELTDLALTKSGVANFTMAVKEWNGDIIFLRKMIPGGASRSYGIQVARLAGLPVGIIERAKEILHNLEKGELTEVGLPRLAQSRRGPAPTGTVEQFQLFQIPVAQQEAAEAIQMAPLDTMTPIEALNLLHALKSKLGS